MRRRVRQFFRHGEGEFAGRIHFAEQHIGDRVTTFLSTEIVLHQRGRLINPRHFDTYAAQVDNDGLRLCFQYIRNGLVVAFQQLHGLAVYRLGFDVFRAVVLIACEVDHCISLSRFCSQLAEIVNRFFDHSEFANGRAGIFKILNS